MVMHTSLLHQDYRTVIFAFSLVEQLDELGEELREIGQSVQGVK